jgi:putative nucleotidyltransferase with HDIG domain
MSLSSSHAYELVLRRIRDIPSLPDIVHKILAVLGRPATPASEIAELISYDPGLTSKVLRMVNSAAYGFQRQISSIQHAVMILGFNNVRGLVLSASIFKLFEGHTRPGGLNHKIFWEHSLGTAIAARLLSKLLRVGKAEDVFSAAMLHDIGKVILDIYFERDYEQVLQATNRQHILGHGDAFLQIENRLLAMNHTEIGFHLATKWKLPVTITEVIQYHHTPQQSRHCQPLVYLVALANEMAVLRQEKSGIYQSNYFSGNVLSYFKLQEYQVMEYLTLLEAELEQGQVLFESIYS